MRYDLDQLQTLLTVLELGTVTSAATRLNLSKSVVSKRISDLELELGTALFRRNAGRIVPTEAAERLAERIRPAIAELRAAAESAAWGGAEALRGTLSVALPVSFGTLHLSPILARFALAHPGLSLRLDYDDRARDLARDGFDVAIRIGPLVDSAMKTRRLCTDRAIPCAAPAFLDRHGRPRTIADLSGLPAIVYGHLSASELWQFTQGGTVHHPRIAPVMSLNNGEAMRDMAIAGLGLAMLPGFIAEPAIAAGLLERILPGAETRELPIAAVWPPVAPMPQKLRAFIDHMATELAGGMPWRNAASGPGRPGADGL